MGLHKFIFVTVLRWGFSYDTFISLSQDGWVGVATRPPSGWPRECGAISGMDKAFSVLQFVQIASESHPFPYSVGTGEMGPLSKSKEAGGCILIIPYCGG